MKLSKYYRKEHVGEDCYVLYNTLHSFLYTVGGYNQ